jgi:hypothetical protein
MTNFKKIYIYLYLISRTDYLYLTLDRGQVKCKDRQ